MSDITMIIATLVFVLIWYGLTLIGRALFKPFEKMNLVWCPEVRSFSFVETQPTSGSAFAPVSLKHCLLWPDHERCKERCVK
jgi:hypothetical protein